MNKVSIIITTYNSEKTIQRALDSLLNQKGKDADFSMEILIVDDCSSDNTLQIIQKNELEHFTTGKNSGGPNKGRNIGLHKATGDFICIMDHDDEWLPDKIQSQLKVCELAPIISTGYYEKDDVKGTIREYVNPSFDLTGINYYKENQTFISYLSRSRIGQKSYIGSLMYHKSLKDVLFEEEYDMVDFDWFLRLFHGSSSVEICKSLFIRHLSSSNLSFNEVYRINDYHYSLKTLDLYKTEYPLEVKLSSQKINGTMGRYYYKMEKMSDARKYFRKSGINLKNIAYLITSYAGYKFINRKFKVF